MRAESHQASVLGILFFNLAEIPGKLQSFGGGGLVSVSERAAGTGEPDRPCRPNSLSCLTGCCRRGLIYLFIFGSIYPRGEERHGDFRLM